MQKLLCCLMAFLFANSAIYAKNDKDSLAIALDDYAKFVDSVNTSLHWQANSVVIASGVAMVNMLCSAFFFCSSKQSLSVHQQFKWRIQALVLSFKV
ncbi:MAG: hypothetical protein ABI683_07640 [Ginsengibacter sp.]